ncbi:MAG: hypothetical protein MUC96_04170 [Myxococcaceae bacterium]|jgi:hypothetical protein|nr:hypothetical protein [Myxococcaceae bacterium]
MTLRFVVLLLVVSSPGLAQPPSLADTVKAAPVVRAAIENARNDLKPGQGVTVGEVTLLHLGGLCGAAGCQATFLGTLTVSSSGSNAPSRTIMLAVSTTNGSLNRVAVLSKDDDTALRALVERSLR